MPDEDQAAESEVNESEAKEAKDNQESKEEEQSDKGDGEKSKGDSKVFKTPDGRELKPEELYDEYNKLIPEFTKRSQKLKELERKIDERQTQAGEDAKTATNEVLKNVSPDIKEAILQIVQPAMDKRLAEREKQSLQKKRDEEFESQLSSLEKEHDGSDGLPKFDRNRVLAAMQSEDNKIFDPHDMYKKLNEAEIIDHKVKQALKQKSGGKKTEKTGTGDRKPDKEEKPKTFEEAAKRALSRVSG